MAKLKRMGIRDSTVGLVIPTGYSFNLDAFSIYITLAAVFIAQATNTPISMADLLTILAISLVTSKGAHGVPGSAIVVLAATLQAIPAIPAIGLVLVLSVDWFMGIARALGNLIGNCVATVAVAAWEGDIDRARRMPCSTAPCRRRSTTADVDDGPARRGRASSRGLKRRRNDTMATSQTEIAQRVVESILAQKLEPGERLGEQELADLFGVSRTLVREALMQLQARGFIEVRPRKGWYVVEPSFDEAREAFAARRAIETGMLREAGRPLQSAIRRLRQHVADERHAIAGGDAAKRTFLLADFHVCLAECLRQPAAGRRDARPDGAHDAGRLALPVERTMPASRATTTRPSSTRSPRATPRGGEADARAHRQRAGRAERIGGQRGWRRPAVAAARVADPAASGEMNHPRSASGASPSRGRLRRTGRAGSAVALDAPCHT